jgi:pilus assembly protein CpaE
VRSFLTRHRSGLSVMCAPESPALVGALTPALLGRLIDVISTMFRYVVIDTGAGIDERTLTAVQRSTDLVMVCATDVASSRGLRKAIEALDAFQLTAPVRHVVLNRADARVGIAIEDIEATIRRPVSVTICSDRAIPTSMNKAAPLMESRPRSATASGFHQLVNRLVPDEVSGWPDTRRVQLANA